MCVCISDIDHVNVRQLSKQQVNDYFITVVTRNGEEKKNSEYIKTMIDFFIVPRGRREFVELLRKNFSDSNY